MRSHQRSIELFEEAQKYIPGGVNSPVRAFKSVGSSPIFIERGKGSKIFDVDGNTYIDYVNSWGPLILGHSHPKIVEALRNYLDRGTSYGAPTELETELAKMIVEAVPSVELVRMVNSGTEATMSALRLARGYTKRSKIIKFEGCYHGHADSLLIKAGSGALTHGVPTSLGIPDGVASDTIVIPYNDLKTLEKIFEVEGENIAAVIIEPIVGNMGVVLPQSGYLESLRELTKKFDVLLIFDEVMTGFRVTYGGVQSLYNVDPDLTCFGKIIGGGLPVGAYGGKKHIMEQVSPLGPVYQAGTLSGNPLAMVAGITTLKILQKPGIYEKLDRKAKYLTEEITKAADSAGIKISLNRAGSMFCIFFTDRKVVDFASARTSDTKKFAAFFKNMLKNGVYLAPSQFESTFVSLAHTDEDIERTIKASYDSFTAIKEL